MAVGAVLQLAFWRRPHTTVPGLLVGALSLGLAIWLRRAEGHAGRLRRSLALFSGSLLSLLFPALWWADAAAALALSGFMVREGASRIRGARKAGS